MRVGDEDTRADLVKQCGCRVRIQLDVYGPGVRSHLAEVLFQHFRLLSKLYTRKEFGPDTEAKRVEPFLLVGHGCYGNRLSASSCTAPTRLSST